MTDAEKKAKQAQDAPFLMPVVQPLATTGIEQSVYAAMLNGPGINQLALINAKTRQATVDMVTGEATITRGDFKLFIDRYDQLAGGLRVSVHKLLDICTIQLTQQNDYRGAGPLKAVVVFPLEEYMRLCGTPMTKASKDKARRRVKEDLEALYNISMEWTERSGRQTKDYLKMRIITQQGIKGGNIVVEFSPQMADYLTHAYIMQYPKELLRVDERNPATYFIGRKLLQHHSMDSNQRKGTANIIGVKTLLACCEDIIPSYSQVMRGDRHVAQRIITPFENALDALSAEGIIQWHYCNSKSEPLAQAQLNQMEYDIFVKLFIHFEALNAPCVAARIENAGAEPHPSVRKTRKPGGKKTASEQITFME